MVTNVCKFYCAICKCCVHINVLLLALTIFVKVKSCNPSETQDTTESSSFKKELRWLIERVHPADISPNQYGVSNSGSIQKSRNAFAAAEYSLRSHLVKRSKEAQDKDFLKKMTSQIKEKEDASIQSALCSPSVDLAFVMDGCGRMPFQICKDFVKNTIRNVKAFNKSNRVGLVMYSKKAKLLFGFNYFTDTQDMIGALDSIRFMPKQQEKAERIGAALKKAQKTLFSGSRTGVQQVLILITGARANDDVIGPSRRLRQDGVIIYGVGVGHEFDESQLEAISSKPVQEHMFTEARLMSNSFPWFLRSNLCRGNAGVVKEGYIQRYQGPANVIFLLDGSGDIGFKEIQFYKLFVKEVYNSIHIPPGGVKFGLLECGTRHYSQENLLIRTFETSKMLDLTLNDLVPMNGNCELEKSLEMLNRKVFKRLPEDAPKALVVVLAGKSLDDATRVANELSEEGVRIVALGTGDQADMKQMVTIADSPLYAFKVPLVKYLPSMSTTVVGFINEVTEPKYSSNSVSSSKAAVVSDEETKAGFQNGFDDKSVSDVDKLGANDDKNLLSGLRPILSELDGEDSSLDWLSMLQGKETPQDYQPTTQNMDPSQNPSDTQNDWNRKENQYETNGQNEDQLQDNAINDATDNLSENSSSNNQDQANVLSNNSNAAVASSQSSGIVNPSSQNAGAATTPNQTGGNQTNGNPGAVSSPSSGNMSNNGRTSPGNGGTTGGSAGNTVGVNQATGTPGVVPLPSGGVFPNSGGPQTVNSGTSGGPLGNTGSTPVSPGQQPGPIQVIQTQLLPIPILPIQTIPIQALSPIQSPQGQVPASNSPPITQNKQQPATNQSQIPQGKTNENMQNLNQVIPSTGPETIKSNQRPKGQETPESQTKTPNGQPTLPSSGSKVTSNQGAKQPLPIVSPAPGKPPEGNKSSNESNSSKTQSSNNGTLPHTSTPAPQNKIPATPKPINATAVLSNKPTSDSSKIGGKANSSSSSVKPNIEAPEKPTQKPQIVLCQIVCGSDCCPLKLEVKLPTSKPTITTPKNSPTTRPPTSARSELKKIPTTPPEVIAGPPIPIGHPLGPQWFPQVAHPMSVGPAGQTSGPLSRPLLPMYITLPPATASPVIGQERFPHEPSLPMYKKLLPVTALPVVSTQKERKDPVFIGQCQDYHPDCASFVMAGMCDEQAPFKDAFNVREVCMLSCGVCNGFIKQGDKVTFDVRNNGKKPEEIGFPEYSKKFLKRQVSST